jgi:hypothetical protein
MRAQNLTISVPYKGCDKNCPYCVSKMTGRGEPNIDLMRLNTEKVLTIARHAGVTNVLFTGKGEPFLNPDELFFMLKQFKEFPCEVQTNGIELAKADYGWTLLEQLRLHGMNVIAISIDDLDDFATFGPLFRHVREAGMITRVALNIHKGTHHRDGIHGYVKLCQRRGVQQIMLRKLSTPAGTPEDNPQVRWIYDNVDEAYWSSMISRFNREREDHKAHGIYPRIRHVRTMAHGDVIWDYEGVAVSHSDYCVQNTAPDGEIRSLIFLDDGHLYTTWNSPASILF